MCLEDCSIVKLRATSPFDLLLNEIETGLITALWLPVYHLHLKPKAIFLTASDLFKTFSLSLGVHQILL